MYFIVISNHNIHFSTEDGFIDEYDLRKTMIQLRLKFTDTDVEEMLNEFAPLRDGPPRIDFEDFLSIVT